MDADDDGDGDFSFEVVSWFFTRQKNGIPSMERSHILPGEKENRLLKVNLGHLKDSSCPLKKKLCCFLPKIGSSIFLFLVTSPSLWMLFQ